MFGYVFLNGVSLSYQFLGDSQAQNSEKYQYIISLENTLKAKDEHIINLENTLRAKDEFNERLNNSLINLSGRMAQSSFPQGSQFVCGPQGPQVPQENIPRAHRRLVRAAPYRS